MLTMPLSAAGPVPAAPMEPPVACADLTALVALGHALKQRRYRFTTVSPASHARVNARAAAAWAHDLAGVFGWSRPFRADAVGAPLLALMLRAGIVRQAAGALASRLRASTLDRQLYFHSAYPTLGHDAVFFGPDTYRFVRALRQALGALPHPVTRAVDIGCGAGPAAVAVALARPDAQVFAVDINPAALALTRVNAELAGAGNVTVVESDLLQGVAGQFDLIVANPPYLLDPARRAYRHGGGALGSALSLAIVQAATQRLAPGGTLMLYTGVVMLAGADPFLMAARPLLESAGLIWTYDEIDPDVFGEELGEAVYGDADRIAAVWLCATKPSR
jgi:methylase of polypeptide subunit release factors